MTLAPPPALPITSRPSTPAPVGVCRVCDCTDDLACPGGCSWVDIDLCSSCHGPEEPTRAQTGELGRIESRKGPLSIRPSEHVGCLEVVLYGTPEDRLARLENDLPTRSLTLDVRGHVLETRLVRA